MKLNFKKCFVLSFLAILCICSINVFAESEEVLGLPKDTDDGIFNWVNREERIYSKGSFDF